MVSVRGRPVRGSSDRGGVRGAPHNARGVAFIEVENEDAILNLVAPMGVKVQWLVSSTPEHELLVEHVRGYEWPDGSVQVFAHGERESMKALRRLLVAEKDVPRTQMSLSGYWARGRSEDRFQAEKREPVGQIFLED
nr:siderophore-interacting protein [Leucobacter coleopterorum]